MNNIAGNRRAQLQCQDGRLGTLLCRRPQSIVPALLVLAVLVTNANAQVFGPIGFAVNSDTSRTRESSSGVRSKSFNPNAGKSKIDIGFAFIRPDWAHDSFRTLVPGSVAADLGLGGELRSGGLDYQPTLNFGIEYKFGSNTDADGDTPAVNNSVFGDEMVFKGQRTSIIGKNHEQFGGKTLLTDATIEFVLASLGPEPFVTVGDYDTLSIGFKTRYVEVNQTYTSSLAAMGEEQSALLTATGRYRGVGFGIYSDYTYELLSLDDWFTGMHLIGGFDTTVSIGQNDRTSSLNVPGSANFTSRLVSKDATEFVFNGEFYGGLRFLFERDLPSDPPKPKLWALDVVFQATYWNNVGLLNPRDVRRSENDLFTYGFMLMGGIAL